MPIQPINSADPTYALIEEVTYGVTPSVGTLYELPASTEQAPPVYKTAEIPSNTKRPKRESNGTQRGMASSEWTIDTRLQKTEVINVLLKSALSGQWASNKLVASDIDSTFSVITTLKPDSAVEPAEPNGLYYVDAGMIVNSLSITANAPDTATVSFGMMGTSRVEADEKHPATFTTISSTAREFTYADLKNVKLTGPEGVVDLGVSSLEFKSDQNREVRAICGQIEGIGIGTQGARTTTLTIKVYRESFKLNTDVTGEPQKISFEIERDGVGYRITLPAAIGQFPSDELSGSSLLANVTFTAAYDNVTASGLFIEQL